MNIWLLEDDQAQAELLIEWLQAEGHVVNHYDRGQSLIDALSEDNFDLIILDWELPDVNGPEVLAAIRQQVSWHVPILFATQRESESDIVAALAQGADDYMVKQVSRAELIARVGALGRRLASEELEFTVGPYRFLPQSQSVEIRGEPCDLTAKDFELAWYLFRHIGRLLSRDQLLKDVWGVSGLNTRTVDVHISRVRKRLHVNSENGYRIRTIYQHGYRLEVL